MRTMQMKVVVRMYKAKAPGALLVDKLIAWRTKSQYSHCELVVGNKLIRVMTDAITVATVDPEYRDHKVYDYIPLQLTITEKQYTDFWQYVYSEVEGKKYDKLNILFSQIGRWGIQDNSKWTCSEATSKLLQLLGEERTWRIHPGDMSPGDVSELLTGER